MADWQEEKRQKTRALAEEVLSISRDQIAVHLRFLDIALAAMRLVPREDIQTMATDGITIYYEPEWVLRAYEKEPQLVARTYLHLLLHLIFFHSFQYDKLNPIWWNLAADIAVEDAILSMELPAVTIKADAEMKRRLAILRKQVHGITAERVYKYFKVNELSESGKAEWQELYHKDEHLYWRSKTEITVMQEQWQKISERVKTDLRTFSKDKIGSKEIEENLSEATRSRQDYSELLRRFTVLSEDMRVNDDEFDYIYYSYGMSLYKNMPLIEPLEYKDSKKIKDFVIALDTSASCDGHVVRGFLKRTYDILKQADSFFGQMNLHVIQCDAAVQKDTKITNQQELDQFLNHLTIKGFGSTDFRPVFRYVEELKKNGEFTNLKGLIYFTDGYGTYPEKMPDYDCMFAFLEEDEHAPKLPPWAIKVILDEEEFEEE